MKYLNELLKYPDRGLLEHEIIITVNYKLLQKQKGGYCENQRMASYNKHEIWYCDPKDIYSEMQLIIDRFNQKCTYRKQFFREALAEFVISFLGIHPFANGNGRTIKFLIWYVLKSFRKIKSFHLLDYNTWCKIIYHKSYDFLLEWLQTVH
jgi:fido (protein-threonine AMPylation protein)